MVVVDRQGKLDIVDLFEIVLVEVQDFVHTAKEGMIASVKEPGLVDLVGIVGMAADMAAGMAGLIDIAAAELAVARIDHVVGMVEEAEVGAAHKVDCIDYTVVAAVGEGAAHMPEGAGKLGVARKEKLDAAHKEMVEAGHHMGMAEVGHRGTVALDHTMDIVGEGMGMDAQVRKSDLADLDHIEADRQLATLSSVNTHFQAVTGKLQKKTYIWRCSPLSLLSSCHL